MIRYRKELRKFNKINLNIMKNTTNRKVMIL